MWYFEEAGQTQGPVPESDVRVAIAAGRISRNTLVWRDGMAGWLPAEATPLVSAFAAPLGVASSAIPSMPLAIVPAQAGYSVPGYGPSGPHFAGFWIRAAAYFIDGLLIQFGAYVIGAVIGLVMAQAVIVADRSMGMDSVNVLAGLAGFAWGVAYYVGTTASGWQATPGKRLLGLRVIRPDGQPVHPGLALGRVLAYLVSGLVFGIGFMMVGWTEQKRALHDMICGTRVVYGRT